MGKIADLLNTILTALPKDRAAWRDPSPYQLAEEAEERWRKKEEQERSSGHEEDK